MAAAVVGLVAPILAASATLARAEVAASEVLTWCGGASQAGQLGAINAFRCVNYLQGAADMVRALSNADLDSCLDGGQSAGAQLMARFIPTLKARASMEDLDATPVARHVADWLASTCSVELTLAAAAPTDAIEPEAPAETEDLSEALAEAQADAAAYASQVEDLQAALEVAVTRQRAELASCTASLETLNGALATSEAEAADNGMRVAELELELEAVNAEAIARRQEISEAENHVVALTDELQAASAARIAADQALTDARREADQLSAIVDQARTAAATAQLSVAAARERATAAEGQAAAAEARVGALETALADAEAVRQRLAADLQQITATAAEQAGRLASLTGDLDACRVTVASATPVAPAPTPSRTAPIPTPSILTTPNPTLGPPASVEGASSITGGSSSITGGSSSITRGEPRPLDAVGIQSLRQIQQATLRQSTVGQRRSWATPDGRFDGFVMVLREGYDGPDYCREIYSEARSVGSVVHQSTEVYCQTGNLWVYIPPGR
ncbi:MAG: hypothetical protein ACFCVH_18290 [Alphaproteobacteria bacterium]